MFFRGQGEEYLLIGVGIREHAAPIYAHVLDLATGPTGFALEWRYRKMDRCWVRIMQRSTRAQGVAPRVISLLFK